MKIVINGCYGGFSLSEAAMKACGANSAHDEDQRTNPILIEMVEHDAEAASGRCAKLEVVEIPDNATDWELDEYDGIENITYVVDGKIHHV